MYNCGCGNPEMTGNMAMPKMHMPNMPDTHMMNMPNMPDMHMMNMPNMSDMHMMKPENMMNMPGKYNPMADMTKEKIETMYPRIYFIINPVIVSQCDAFTGMAPLDENLSKEQMDRMVDNVYRMVEGQVNAEYGNMEEMDNRQPFGFGRRRFLRDVIGILLIRELIGRRRRPGYGYPGFGGYPGYGYGGGYGPFRQY